MTLTRLALQGKESSHESSDNIVLYLPLRKKDRQVMEGRRFSMDLKTEIAQRKTLCD